MLIEAELVPLDITKAEEILNKFSITDGSEIPVLYGSIRKKNGDYKKSFDFFFEMASKTGNGEGKYEYGTKEKDVLKTRKKLKNNYPHQKRTVLAKVAISSKNTNQKKLKILILMMMIMVKHCSSKV